MKRHTRQGRATMIGVVVALAGAVAVIGIFATAGSATRR